MWHSLAHSFNKIENLGIADTFHESFSRYACLNHEKEILDEFLKSDVHENLLIHVHTKIKFSELNDVDLVFFGNRNLFTWRTSIISHVYLKIGHNWRLGDSKRALSCRHPQMCTRKNQFHLYFSRLYEAITDSIFEWKLCAIPKSNLPKYDILTYDDDTISQLELGDRISDIICNGINSPKFILKRYGSAHSNLKIRGSHDSIGVQRLLGNFINILTLPLFLIIRVMRGIKQNLKSFCRKSPFLQRLLSRDIRELNR